MIKTNKIKIKNKKGNKKLAGKKIKSSKLLYVAWNRFLKLDNNDYAQCTSCSTYWWCEESLLAGWLGAGPEAGVMMGWAGMSVEWQVCTGEVRWWRWTRWSWTFRWQTAAFTVTAAVAAAGRRCRRHLQRLTQSIYICHSHQQKLT